MQFGDRIKSLRKSQKITLEDIAKVVGVSRQTIQKYESGVIQNIPFDRVELLAKALSVSPGYLLDWEREPDDFNLGGCVECGPDDSKSVEPEADVSNLYQTVKVNLMREIARYTESLKDQPCTDGTLANLCRAIEAFDRLANS